MSWSQFLDLLCPDPTEKRNTTQCMSWSQWALFLDLLCPNAHCEKEHYTMDVLVTVDTVSWSPWICFWIRFIWIACSDKACAEQTVPYMGTAFEFPSSETWVSTLHGSLKHLLRPVYKIMCGWLIQMFCGIIWTSSCLLCVTTTRLNHIAFVLQLDENS